VPATSSCRSSTRSGSRTALPTSPSRARAAPYGSSPRQGFPPCSFRVSSRPAATNARTRSGSRRRAARSSCRSRTCAAYPISSDRCSTIRRSSRRWQLRCAPPRSPTPQRGSPMSSSSSLAGRRFWIAGIGGAGMSAYALLAHAWGAEVAGWDRVDTPYLAHLEGIDVAIAPDPPRPPDGWEVYVSTAFAGRVQGRPRADLLAELVSLRRSIVVAGAHGKTTTSAMITFCLDRLGLDPAFLIGGDVAQLGGNARAGEGWLVVEGDESDRSVSALRPEIAVLLNVDLDHHTTFVSRAEVEAL